jgi:hypothetical protein
MTALMKLLLRAPDLDHSPASPVSAASHSTARIGVPECHDGSRKASTAQHDRITNGWKGSELMNASAAEAVRASSCLDTGHSSILAVCRSYSR